MTDDSPKTRGGGPFNAEPPVSAPDRRRLLKRLALLAGAVAAYPAWRTLSPPSRPDAAAWRAEAPWTTLDAVLRHLLPSAPDTPGAAEIGALDYLRAALDNPDADGEDREFIAKGAGWLDELTQADTRKPFLALDEAAREQALRKIEASAAGSRWLSLLLSYLLEALLADPVYGGNRNGIGWVWLEHQPGYPTPTPDKTWWRLGKPARTRDKAA